MRTRSTQLRSLLVAALVALGVLANTLTAAADVHGGPWPK